MSVADHEIEEPSEEEWRCPIHGEPYIRRCQYCADDEADRAYESQLEYNEEKARHEQ